MARVAAWFGLAMRSWLRQRKTVMAVTLCAAGIGGLCSNPFRFLTAGEREEAASVCAGWRGGAWAGRRRRDAERGSAQIDASNGGGVGSIRVLQLAAGDSMADPSECSRAWTRRTTQDASPPRPIAPSGYRPHRQAHQVVPAISPCGERNARRQEFFVSKRACNRCFQSLTFVTQDQ